MKDNLLTTANTVWACMSVRFTDTKVNGPTIKSTERVHSQRRMAKYTWASGLMIKYDSFFFKKGNRSIANFIKLGIQRSGYGKQTYSDGSWYEGQWSDNKRNGKGTWVHPAGYKYEGQWKDDSVCYLIFADICFRLNCRLF